MKSRQRALGDAKVFISDSLATAKGYETTYSKDLGEVKPAKLLQELGAIETLASKTDDQAQIIRLEDEELPEAYITYCKIVDKITNKINAELFCRTL